MWVSGENGRTTTVSLAQVTFRNNSNTYVGGMGGGGLSSYNGNLTLVDVTFSDNEAPTGGGMSTTYGDVTVTNAIFSGNRAVGGCGGLIVGMSHLAMTNATFSDNSAAFGGAMCKQMGSATLTNVTCGGNTATEMGGAIYDNSTYFGGPMTLQNSILWGNTAPQGAQIYQAGSRATLVDYSDVQGGWDGEGNIDTDPRFVDAANGNLRLRRSSPAADAGNQTLLPVGITTDLDGNPRVMGDNVDMGAYELQINTAPVADPGGPYLGAVNTAIPFDGSASADAEGDPLTYAWTFGDGGTGTDAMPTHSYTAAGIYAVCLTVNDGELDSEQSCTIAVVYDSSAGFVTGGGWINSPAGACQLTGACQGAVGKATFGFVSNLAMSH